MENFSLLIPTLNRSQFVARALWLYAELGFAGTILIGDSSQGDEYLASQEAVNRFNTKLNVRHIFLPPEEFPTCGAAVKHLISISETDYLAQFGDDDVLLPSGVRDCIEFLEESPDYAAACGIERVEFSLLGGAVPYGDLSEMRLVSEPELDSSDSKARFISYMRNAIAPSYSIFRREILELAYKSLDSATTRYVGPELLAGALAVVEGRVKRLDVVTLMFQVHSNHHFSWHNSTLFDLFFDEGFGRTIGIFRESVSDALFSGGTCSRAEAISITEFELFRHFSKLLSWQYKSLERKKRPEGQRAYDEPGIMLGGKQTVKDFIRNKTLIELYWLMRKRMMWQRCSKVPNLPNISEEKYSGCRRVAELLRSQSEG